MKKLVFIFFILPLFTFSQINTTTSNEANLYKNLIDFQYNVTIPAYSNVIVISKNNNYFKIIYNNDTGFVYAGYLNFQNEMFDDENKIYINSSNAIISNNIKKDKKENKSSYYMLLVGNLVAPNYGVGFMWDNNQYGIYFDAKFKNKFSVGYEYMSTMSDSQAKSFGDSYSGDDYVDGILNAGGCFLLKDFVFYSGIGFAYRGTYHNYYDSMKILGKDGKYSVLVKEQYFFNFDAGFMYKPSKNILLRLGFETYVPGVVVGFGFRL